MSAHATLPISGGRIAFLGIKKGDHVKKAKCYCAYGTMTSRRKIISHTQVASSQKRIVDACAIADNAERDAARMAKLRLRGFIS